VTTFVHQLNHLFLVSGYFLPSVESICSRVWLLLSISLISSFVFLALVGHQLDWFFMSIFFCPSVGLVLSFFLVSDFFIYFSYLDMMICHFLMFDYFWSSNLCNSFLYTIPSIDSSCSTDIVIYLQTTYLEKNEPEDMC